ncbi:hypothetical protein [Massilia glaciei]|nr:hypothetical protein [Massilia glaciei]
MKAAVVFAATVAIIGGVFYWINKSKQDSLNSITMCPVLGPKGHIVLLIDTTDPFTFTQKEAFLSLMRDVIQRRTPEGYLLSIFVLGADYKEHAKPIAELCNPGTGLGKSEWTADLKNLRSQYENKFVAPITKQAELLIGTQPAKASPIFEMVQLVGINAFELHAINGDRRLIIVSDMLHNTTEYSMYAGQPDFPTFSSSNYGRRSQSTLNGIDVELHYLMNSPRLQERPNVLFWEAYFDKAKARLVAVNPLAG